MLCIPRLKVFVPVTIPPLSVVQELKLLGVVFNSECNWKSHINHVVKISSRNLFLIRLLKANLSNDSLILVYFALIRSILEYCSPLFIGLNKTECYKLEKMQKRFHRILCGTDCDRHKFETLCFRRNHAAVTLFKDAMACNHILNKYMPMFSRSGRAILQNISQERRLKSFFNKASIMYNEIFKR